MSSELRKRTQVTEEIQLPVRAKRVHIQRVSLPVAFQSAHTQARTGQWLWRFSATS